jgi:hypothetical protein
MAVKKFHKILMAAALLEIMKVKMISWKYMKQKFK